LPLREIDRFNVFWLEGRRRYADWTIVRIFDPSNGNYLTSYTKGLMKEKE